ncbi:hypothetical protein [Proteus vulgaris]|uniref:hypothetical protein n=1 Tax=Proteus vulgaris TaxID=585 RepID=UPI0032DAF8EC
MIKLSSKLENIIFWASTVSISLIVFGIFVIDIFVTDAHGKDKLSIIFSYLSTIFAFLSALALFATIGVYLHQINIKKREEEKEIKAYINNYAHGFHKNTIRIVDDINELIYELNHNHSLVINSELIDIANQMRDIAKENISLNITIPLIENYTQELHLNRIAQLDIELFNIITTELYYVNSIIKNVSLLNKQLSKKELSEYKNNEIPLILHELYKDKIHLENLIADNPYRNP